jgi:hypothetical protein
MVTELQIADGEAAPPRTGAVTRLLAGEAPDHLLNPEDRSRKAAL